MRHGGTISGFELGSLGYNWVITGYAWFLFVLNEPRTRWLQLILGEFLLQIVNNVLLGVRSPEKL